MGIKQGKYVLAGLSEVHSYLKKNLQKWKECSNSLKIASEISLHEQFRKSDISEYIKEIKILHRYFYSFLKEIHTQDPVLYERIENLKHIAKDLDKQLVEAETNLSTSTIFRNRHC